LSNEWFDPKWVKISPFPSNYIPKEGEVFIGIDYASDGDCTVRCFYERLTGEYHIQEIEYNKLDKQ